MASRDDDGYWNEDMYWNETTISKFKFDDDFEEEHDEGGERVGSMFESGLQPHLVVPLQSIIPQKNLDSVLSDVRIPESTSLPPVSAPVAQMFLGHSFNLYHYCTLEEKLNLLDSAIKSNDGNIILKVVLFMSKRLKPSILYRYLMKRPVALAHYANYLEESNRIHELELLYTATGNKNYLINLFYLSSKKTSPANINKKLSQFMVEHLDNLKDDFDKTIFTNYKKFIQFKLDNRFEGDTPIGTLARLYHDKIDCGDVRTNSYVAEFVKLMRISDFQSEWTLMNVMAAKQMWNKINELFVKTNWFTKKNVLKSTVTAETLLTGLYNHDAPKSVIENMLSLMVDVEKSVLLGMRLKCHKYVVETLVGRRDKIALLEYRSQLPQHSEFVAIIDNALGTM